MPATPHQFTLAFLTQFFLFWGGNLLGLFDLALTYQNRFKFYLSFIIWLRLVCTGKLFSKNNPRIEVSTKKFKNSRSFCRLHFKSFSRVYSFTKILFLSTPKKDMLAKKQIWFLFIEVLSFHLLFLCYLLKMFSLSFSSLIVNRICKYFNSW